MFGENTIPQHSHLISIGDLALGEVLRDRLQILAVK